MNDDIEFIDVANRRRRGNFDIDPNLIILSHWSKCIKLTAHDFYESYKTARVHSTGQATISQSTYLVEGTLPQFYNATKGLMYVLAPLFDQATKDVVEELISREDLKSEPESRTKWAWELFSVLNEFLARSNYLSKEMYVDS